MTGVLLQAPSAMEILGKLHFDSYQHGFAPWRCNEARSCQHGRKLCYGKLLIQFDPNAIKTSFFFV